MLAGFSSSVKKEEELQLLSKNAPDMLYRVYLFKSGWLLHSASIRIFEKFVDQMRSICTNIVYIKMKSDPTATVEKRKQISKNTFMKLTAAETPF
ncbi:hypothetical protein AVEN_245998-1 [Araneus ventricosus]|uniref:Uncharacterized protein n=1 Tax=Araneus ventricosus TaxID=182803 RepID=A0A4Y2FHP3_ARAVE|nr:hypothetical protein AVEN_245998-1 [Araneus ventricosus]